MSPLHQGARPRRQIPVGLHSEDVGLDAPPRARPGSEHQLRTLRGRTPGTSRMDQSGSGDTAEEDLHRSEENLSLCSAKFSPYQKFNFTFVSLLKKHPGAFPGTYRPFIVPSPHVGMSTQT